MEARGYAHTGRLTIGLTVDRTRVLLVGCLLVAALLLRIDGISRPSLEERELHNALLARQYYLGDGAGLPAWKQRVLWQLHRSVQPVEPPVLDHIAAWGFRLTGGEKLWFPRFISALLWVTGGVFLYLIGLRVTSREGALVALALYLFWPYGVLISRLYMPDPMMVALILAGGLAVIRYWEGPSARRLAVASGVAALATAAKPGIAFFFLAAAFVVLAVSQRALRRTLRWHLPVFAAVAVAPTIAYFVYGSYIRDFLSVNGDAGGRLQPHLVTTGWFWRGWWEQLSILLPFPQPQRALALVPLLAGLAGLLVVRAERARAILIGLGLGYVAYALAFAGYTADNAYYGLPLIPLLALSIGGLVGFLLERSGTTRPMMLRASVGLILFVVAVGVYKSQPAAPDRQTIADYRRIGQITDHTTRAVIVNDKLAEPLMYWGWIVGHYWYQPTPGMDLAAQGDPFPAWVDSTAATYLIVTDVAELRTERRLIEMTRTLPIVARTNRYVVFDVRRGRLARAAVRTGS